MNFALLVGLLTSIVSGVFAFLVLQRYFTRGGTHLLLWGLGLVLYFIGGITEVILAFGWSELAFRSTQEGLQDYLAGLLHPVRT